MTKTVREREPSSLPLYKLYTLFRLHFTPERNVQHSRADFFDLKREDGESAADVWKRILEVEKKCEFETITAAELLASKFLSVIGKSTGDYDLKKKIRKSDMSIEAITEALHEYMYEKLYDSPETEEEKKIRYLNERKTRNTKDLSEKPTKFKKVDCNRCGAPNWSRQHECPAKGKKCIKCEKIGHYAKYCRTNKRVNHVQDDEASSAEEDDWSPNTIHSVNQMVHSTRQTKKNGPEFFSLTALVNNRPIKFIIYSGSPVTLIPKSQFNSTTPLMPIGTEYRDVNDNRIKFEGKTIASVEINRKRNNFEVLITTKKTNPLLGSDWMGITLDTNKINPQVNHVIEDSDVTVLRKRYKKLFNENHTVIGIEVKIQLKENARLIQQKGRPIPIHLQQSVGKEINKLIKQGHIEKANNIDENCFVSPAVITVKKDKSVKMALDSRKRNYHQKKGTNAQHGGINFQNLKKNCRWPSRRNLDIKTRSGLRIWPANPIQRTHNLCIFAVTGGDFTGYYRFLKGFYGLADIPTIFQEKIDQTLENKHPAWLDDIIIVTKGSKEQHKKELIEVLIRLENAGYRLSGNKSEFFKSEIEWIRHKIDQNGIRPLQDKLMAIKNLKQPNNEKELKSFLGAIQYLSKYIDNLSAQTDSLRQLLKKDNDWIWTEEHTAAFEMEQAVRETEKNFSSDLQLLMSETTNDPVLLKTLVCLERQQHDQIPDEYLLYKKKLSSRFGLVFIEDKIIVPKNLRTTIISLLHKGHPVIKKMTTAARHFWWPKMTEAIQKKCESCIPCKMSGKSIKSDIPSTEKNHLLRLENPNEEIQ